MNTGTNVIDAAVRFARSNPDVLAVAREGASSTGRSVDELLAEAVARMRAASAQSKLDECLLPGRGFSERGQRRYEGRARHR